MKLRDAIMQHASELIRQIIRKQGLHTIYPGQDESSFGDLLQVGWTQVERTLYKFRARPHCRPCYNPDRPNDSVLYNPADTEYGIITYEEMKKNGIIKCKKCETVFAPEPVVQAVQDTYGGSTTVLFRGISKVFNMWSQVSRTVILAHIKKEGRDRKNATSYRNYIDNKPRQTEPYVSESSNLLNQNIHEINPIMVRFLSEAKEICKYNNDFLLVLTALEHLLQVDDRPSEGLIGKLVEHSGLSRITVTQFMKTIRLRSFEFTDSPINRSMDNTKVNRKSLNGEFEEE